MKIKLNSLKSDVNSQRETMGQDENMEQDEQSAFRSRSTEHRAYVKAKVSLPKTPRRISRIIEKLIESPRTRMHTETKGVYLPRNAQNSCRWVKLSWDQ